MQKVPVGLIYHLLVLKFNIRHDMLYCIRIHKYTMICFRNRQALTFHSSALNKKGSGIKLENASKNLIKMFFHTYRPPAWLLKFILSFCEYFRLLFFLTLTNTNCCRHLRLAELLRQYSSKSELVVMTLPLPRRGHTSPSLYMAWLEIMTRNLPPILLTRGNQESVLTFYS